MNSVGEPAADGPRKSRSRCTLVRKLGLTSSSNKQRIVDFKRIVQEQQQKVLELEQQRRALRTKEAVLLQMLSEQDSNLHHLALLLLQGQEQQHRIQTSASWQSTSTAQAPSGESGEDSTLEEDWVRLPLLDNEAIVQALAADLHTFQLLQQIGRPSQCLSTIARSSNQQLAGQEEQQLHTRQGHHPQPEHQREALQQQHTQSSQPQHQSQLSQQSLSRKPQFSAEHWRDVALTEPLAQNVQHMRNAPVQELAGQLRDLTMRLGFVLQSASSSSPGEGSSSLQDSLEKALDEYGQFVALLHSVADKQCLQLCCMNLETLEEQEPPAGFWEQVAESLGLTAEQHEAISASFVVHTEQRQPLLDKMRDAVRAVHQCLGAPTADAAVTGQQHTATLAGLDGCAAASWAPGFYDLESAELADALLAKLARYTRQLRELSRRLTWAFVNSLTTEQLAVSAATSYPYWVQPPPICEYIWRKHRATSPLSCPNNNNSSSFK